MNRAYAVLTVKAVEDDKRVIRGVATTPASDRVGDIIDPLGVKFTNPMPFLWQHDHDKPIGTVSFDKPTKDGVTFTATLPTVVEPGLLKDRIDEAWQSIKLGLIRAVSIGFRPLEWAFMDGGGIRFDEIEVYELSAVTVPANAEAVIASEKAGEPELLAVLKSFDLGCPAASGRPQAPETPAGVTAKSHPSISLTPKEGATMNIAEQIAALEAKRVAHAARLEEIQTKAAAESRTKDTAEREEFTTLRDELKSIDEELGDLRDLQKMQAAAAKPVDRTIATPEAGAAARGGQALAEVRLKKAEAPGVRFARLAKVKAIGRMDNDPSLVVAERMYGTDSEVYALIKAEKAAVTAGSNVAGNWAVDLTGSETSAFADFAAYLRPATILGKFGVNGVPDLRHVPFREPLISQTGGGAGYWVGEGKPKPLTSFDFDRTTLTPLKVANIAVLTEENIRSSNPSSELIVRDALRDALQARMDTDFIDPTNAGTSNVKPASITNGAAAIVSPGTDADDVRLGVRAIFQKFIDADNPPEAGVWIMSTTNALALSLMLNPLGQREFPDITMTGGRFEGLPVIASRYAGAYVALVNASDIYEADEGEVAVDMSREASLEMLDTGLSQDATAGTGASLVSLWQNNLVGLRAERTINWKRRRASAVAYLTAVTWGGSVPAS